MSRSKLFLMILALFVIAMYSTDGRAIGIPEYAKDLPQSLKNNCNVCHEKASGGPLNDFGKNYAMYGRVMEAIKGLDSDGDGYDNGEELAAGTLPGFASSYPGKKRSIDAGMVALVVTLIAVIGLVLRKRMSG